MPAEVAENVGEEGGAGHESSGVTIIDAVPRY